MKEKEPIESFQNGNDEAFDEIVTLYQQRGLRTAYLIVGDQSDAQDVLQDTFVKIYLHRDRLKNSEVFSSWFYKILVRTAWEAVRKKKKEVACEDTLFCDKRDESTNVEEEMIRLQQSDEIRQAIESLSLEQRTVVVLFYYQGFSIKEIAGMTGTLEATVKSRMFLARRKLRKLLSAEVKVLRCL